MFIIYKTPDLPLPKEIIIVDNNQDQNDSIKLRQILSNFETKVSFKIMILKSSKNSSSIARNIGAMKCNTDLVAFLDSDIVLFKDYYEKILNYFKLYDDLIAIQGLDINLIFNDKNFEKLSLFKRHYIILNRFLKLLLYLIEKKTIRISIFSCCPSKS